MSVLYTKREILIDPALSAGITLPPDVDHYDQRKFRQFNLFKQAQLENDYIPNEFCIWHNAVVIAGLSENDVENASWTTLRKAGFKGCRR